MELAGRTLLGKYRIEALLGQGGMGRVWKGAHVVTGRRVAVKVLDERFLSNTNVVQRFGREARAASAIQHEGIVEVLDLDQTEEGIPFLVMEFLDGETLGQRIERKGRLAQEETVRIAALLLDALEAAHAHGVIHRDLKPDNIFLVEAGRRREVVKILDFGISHKDDEAQAKLTMTGSVLGTPHYMSPEQAMGEVNLDKRIDVYGAGVVIYECLVGDVPFDAPNYNKLLRIILDEEPAPPSQRGAILEPALERVVMKALAKDRDQRPASARALQRELQRALTGNSSPPERAAVSGERRIASTRFPKPDASSTSSSSGSIASASSSGVHRSGSPSSSGVHPSASPYGSSSGGMRSATPSSSGTASSNASSPGDLSAPRIPAPASTGFALSELEVFSGPARIEIDETALARPGRGRESSSGQRLVSERSLAAMRGELDRSTPGASRGPVSSRPPPATPSRPPSHHPMPEPAAEHTAPTLRDRFEALPDTTRRAILVAIAGFAVFILLIAIVRMIVRPGLEDEAPDGRAASQRYAP